MPCGGRESRATVWHPLVDIHTLVLYQCYDNVKSSSSLGRRKGHIACELRSHEECECAVVPTLGVDIHTCCSQEDLDCPKMPVLNCEHESC